ncbi:uncharacterized protein [Physcomitrium patens]|uniref:CRAL-TRIO domain-containing protein n=1 Tax=Physcomitrium patens TaxID=3218 RepID=A0A2K1J964_PHYPA|nr:uncharacterized protein LOC112293220 [Physcomitrium patens]PNR38059.1 hypothetical protein PHYPA_021170 [Physcomitrium patens]|eukprot:XP_024398179.1 uncharacterized protein LOC112293220 [Physcomitrella patens]
MERSSSIMTHPAKVEPEGSLSEMIKEVLRLVQKERVLSKKQADFCDDACVLRYLRARGNNVRRAARMLRATLNWREKINIGYLIADEFPAELAAGAAYVAGHDDEGRPVLVIKKKPDYILNKSYKEYLRHIIFTMEVAVAAMPPGVAQWVLILDAGGYSRLSAPSTSGILSTLKMLADHYPERLAKAFIVDASSMFYYFWKGICTFVDHATRDKLVFSYSRDYRAIPRSPRTSKTSFLTSPFSKRTRMSTSFCAEDVRSPAPFRTKSVSADYALLDPIFDASPKSSEDKKSPNMLFEGPELASSLRRRSFSFSSVTGPITCASPDFKDDEFSSFRNDEEIFDQSEISGSEPGRTNRGKVPSWDGLISIFYPLKRTDTRVTSEVKHRNVDTFRPYLKFLQATYDESAYRALMKPPLGGLATIISRDLKHISSL